MSKLLFAAALFFGLTCALSVTGIFTVAAFEDAVFYAICAVPTGVAAVLMCRAAGVAQCEEWLAKRASK